MGFVQLCLELGIVSGNVLQFALQAMDFVHVLRCVLVLVPAIMGRARAPCKEVKQNKTKKSLSTHGAATNTPHTIQTNPIQSNPTQPTNRQTHTTWRKLARRTTGVSRWQGGCCCASRLGGMLRDLAERFEFMDTGFSSCSTLFCFCCLLPSCVLPLHSDTQLFCQAELCLVGSVNRFVVVLSGRSKLLREFLDVQFQVFCAKRGRVHICLVCLLLLRKLLLELCHRLWGTKQQQHSNKATSNSVVQSVRHCT